jgi:alkylhydroperoxidase family enzyme
MGGSLMSSNTVPNYERAFNDHPAVYAAWAQLIGAIRAEMDPRRYALVTLAAARAIRSSYCSLAHGKFLEEEFGESVVAIVDDPRVAGLPEVDIAVMHLAEKVATDAPSVTDEDRRRLHELGLTERDVAHVVFAAAARCFFAKALDGLGARPDASFNDLSDELRAVLVVGTPIAEREAGI